MSRILSELLGAEEPFFSQTIKELETASDSEGIDIRLSTDIEQKISARARELGLDPKDINGRELYHGLQGLVAMHETFLAKAIGLDDPTDVDEAISKVKTKLDSLSLPRSAWVLKHSVARRLLKQMPPKKVMKQLGYRSIDSMLKRENISELYGALRFSESLQWQQRFIKTYKHLRPQDFESRDIEILTLSGKKWGNSSENFVRDKRVNITHLKELGVVIMLPLPVKHLQGACLALILLTLHYIDEIRSYSSLFKLNQVKPDFANLLIKTLIYDPSTAVTLLGKPIHWRVVRRHFGKSSSSPYPEIFEPHLQAEDLFWRRTEEILYRIEPALKFWEDMDYCGIYFNTRPVSFNLMDNVVNYCNNIEYGNQVIFHFQSSLWSELLTRYIGQKKLEEEVLKQIDNSLNKTNIMSMTEGLNL